MELAEGGIDHSAAWVILHTGPAEEAEAAFRQVIRDETYHWAQVPVHLGDALMRLGRYDEADQYFQAVLEANTANARNQHGPALRFLAASAVM